MNILLQSILVGAGVALGLIAFLTVMYLLAELFNFVTGEK